MDTAGLERKWVASKFFGFLLILALVLVGTPAQRLGEHATAGFNNQRTYVNAHIGELTPPLKLLRTIGLPEITEASQILAFEGYLLVGELRDLVSWVLVDRESGEELWRHELPRGGSGSNWLGFVPAYANDIVLLGGSSAGIRAVKVSTGAELWRDESIGNSGGRFFPLLSGKMAIYGGENGTVAADAASGEVIWQFTEGIAVAPLSLQENQLYLLDRDNVLYCLERGTGQTIWQTAVMEGATPDGNPGVLATDTLVFVYDMDDEIADGVSVSSLWAFGAGTGEVVWKRLLPEGFVSISSLLLANDRLFGLVVGRVTEGTVKMFSPETGENILTTVEEGLGVPVTPPPGQVLAFPLIGHNVLYYYNQATGHIRARDLIDGRLLWSRKNGEVRSLSLADGSLFALFGDRVDLYQPSNEVYLPHVANGAGQRTLLVLNSVSNETATGSVSFYSDEGGPLELPVQGLGVVSTVPFSIPAWTSTKIETSGSEELQVGWALVDTDRPVQGSSIFQYVEPGSEAPSEAGVEAAVATGRAQVYVERLGEYNTGVAVANPSNDRASVEFRLLVDEEVMDFRRINVPASGHLARFVDQLFDEAPEGDFRGTLIIESEIPVAVTAVRAWKGIQVSSYPIGAASGSEMP